MIRVSKGTPIVLLGLYGHTHCFLGCFSQAVAQLCPWARHFYLCLVLIQPSKTRPNMTEKLLAGI